MSYGFGFDPAMAADADRIFQLVVDTMFNQGQIDANQRNVLMSQYGTYRSSIINDVVTKASQSGRSPDQQMIQESIHGFVTNVIQSYANRSMGTYGGYGQPAYGQPTYGGYGAPVGGMVGGYGQPTYAGYQAGTLYSNPRYHMGQPGYGQPAYAGYQGGYQTGYRGGYVPQQQDQVTQQAAVTASRFAGNTPAPQQAPAPAPTNNVFDKRPAQAPKVEYNTPMVLNEEQVKNDKFTGSKKTVRISADRMADIFIGKLEKPVTNFREFMKRMSSLVTSKNQFMMVGVQVPKVLKAKTREVNAILQKMAAFINTDMAANGNGLDAIPGLFKRFYAEWIKETGEAHKELTRILVDEINYHIYSGYLNSGCTPNLKIGSLDDVFELFDNNTSIELVKQWQQSSNYTMHLSSVVYHAILSVFLGRNDYRTLNPNNQDDNRLVASIFSDLSVDGFMVKDSFQALSKAIGNAKVEPTTATAVPALNTAISERAIILVPRIFVYTNLAPAGFVVGDYAFPNLTREVAAVSNVLEDYLLAGYKALNTNGTTPVVQGILCTGVSMFGFHVGTNTEKHLFIGPAKDPVITF